MLFKITKNSSFCGGFNMLAQGMALCRGVALLEWVWHFWRNRVTVGRGGALRDLPPSCLVASLLLFASQLLLHHACLDAAMLPALMMMD